MFLRNFVKNGFLGAVGSMPDYWIMLNAAGYMEKGVLTEQDLGDIQAAIDAKNAPPVTEEPDADGVENNADTDGADAGGV